MCTSWRCDPASLTRFTQRRVVAATVGLRASDKEEADGLDISIHEERGYVLDAR